MKCPNCNNETRQLAFKICDTFEYIKLYYCKCCEKIWKPTISEINY